MNWKTSLIILSAILSQISAIANGGPVDICLFRKTGNIRLLKKADIQLLKEDLSLKVEGDYTNVQVKYTLQNNGKEETIIYGFPIDAYEGGAYIDPENRNPFGWKHKDVVKVKNFNVSSNGQPVKITNWVRDSLYTVGRYKIYRKWYVVKIDFKQGEHKELEVEYTVENNKSDVVRGFEFVHRFSDRNFTYHLFPSSKWGNGIVNEFSVDIDISELKKNNCIINVEGIDSLKQTEYGYSYKTDNYDLKKSNRINITYDNSHLKKIDFLNKYKLDSLTVKKIRASTDPENIKNLTDKNPKTFWTGSIGDWIEVEFRLLKRANTKHSRNKLRGILFLNGNYSSPEAFSQSGKLRKCTLVLNDSIYYSTEPWEIDGGNKIVTLRKPQYKTFGDLSGNVEKLADNPYLAGRRNRKPMFEVVKVRIYIKGVYKGVVDDRSFSISELYFVGY